MANCPKCGRKLRLTDWRPECPGCGVNLNYYKSNEKLLEESETVEIKHAKFQPRVDRAKAATIGSKEAIIRLVLFIIPVLALLAPIFSVTVCGNKKYYGAIGIYNVVSSIDTGKALGNISPLIIGIALAALSAVLSIVFAALQITSGTPKGLKRNIAYSIVPIVLALCSLVSMIMFTKQPYNDYMDMVFNETEFVTKSGDQKTVDRVVEELRFLSNDDKVDLGILLRAIKNGQDALETAEERGYSEDKIAALKDEIIAGTEIIQSDKHTVKDVREAAEKINATVDTYDTTEIEDTEEEDSEKNKAPVDPYDKLEKALKLTSGVENNGIYSEKTFESFTEARKNGQEILDKHAKGEAIVETYNEVGKHPRIKFEDGKLVITYKEYKQIPKSEAKIERETNKKISEAAESINNAKKALIDPYDKLKKAVKFTSNVENNGIYSEKTFESFTEALKNGQEILDTHAKGEAIVETYNEVGKHPRIKFEDGKLAIVYKEYKQIPKSETEIEIETNKKISEAVKSISNTKKSLVDVSVIVPLSENFKTAFDEGTIDFNSSAIGIGIFLLLALCIAQVVYNILLKKKGVEIKYTKCLIGGLPSDEYFELIENKTSRADINRKMLFALAKLEEQSIKEETGKEEE